MIQEQHQIIPLVYVECGLLVLSMLFAYGAPGFARSRLRPVARWCTRLASPRARAVWLAAVLTFGLSAGLSVIRWPTPRVQDEFSYLLAADTFSHGRLTNPTHPLWEHFESKHILVKPTYQSKYPPGQGVALAVGQIFTGQPLVGVWLSMGLAAAGLCWMLQAWFPARWALFGALLPALHFGVLDSWYRGRFFYWSQSYWGGAVAMLGGALVFGALRRMVGEPRIRDSVLLALGLVVLANSRPYEGFLVGLPAAIFLVLLRFRRKEPGWQEWLSRVVLPIVCVLAVGAAGIGYCNFRVTGHPLKMPHAVHEKTSGTRSHFVFDKIVQLTMENEDSQDDDFIKEEAGRQDKPRSKGKYLGKEYKRRFQWLYFFFVGPLLTLPFLAGFGTPRGRWSWLALATVGLVLSGNIVTISGFPHYFAPVAGLLVVLIVAGMRRLQFLRWRGKRVGRVFVGGLVISVFATLLTAIGLHAYYAHFVDWPSVWSERRAEVVARLEKLPGKHLVLVRSPPEDDKGRNDEWVYNGADIDGSKIVWARELQPAQNARLFKYFSDREFYFLKADTSSLVFTKIEVRDGR